MNKLQRDKKFPFKPSLTPLTERLAMSARLQQEYSSTDLKKQTPEKKKRKRWEDLYAEN